LSDPEDLIYPHEKINKIIHEPARLVIIKFLYVLESADMLFLKKHTALSWGNLSAHVSRLKSAGYLSTEKDFINNKPHTLLRITDAGKESFESYRENMRNLLNS